MGNKPQCSRVYTKDSSKDPLAHLPSSHLLSRLIIINPEGKPFKACYRQAEGMTQAMVD